MPELGDGILGRHLLRPVGAPRPGRVPQPARVRRRRRAAHDPLAGVGPLGRAEGAPAHRRGAAPLHRRARPAGARRRRRTTRPSSGPSSPPPASSTAPTSAGLQTRFATTAGVDLRGPTVSVHTLHHLARVMPDPHPPTPDRARPGRGTRPRVRHHAEPESRRWRTLDEMRDPIAHPARRVHRVHRPVRAQAAVDATLGRRCSTAGQRSSAAAARPSYLKVDAARRQQAPSTIRRAMTAAGDRR